MLPTSFTPCRPPLGVLIALLILAGAARASGTFQLTSPGKPGSSGLIPALVGSGTASPGSTDNELLLADAQPGGAAILVVGLSQLALPFQGGILGPNPDILLYGFNVDAGGGIALPFTLPLDVPDGLQLWSQYWIADPGAAMGRSASNTVLMTVEAELDLFPDYVDPQTEDFHPLGAKTAAAYRLDEGMTYFNRTNGTEGSYLLTRDDIHQGSAIQSHSLGEMAVGGFAPRDACSGDLDGDGILEAIYVGLVFDQGAHTGIRVSQPDVGASPQSYDNAINELQGGTSGWWTGLIGVHCAAGDVDGDGVDELVLTESRAGEMRLRVVKLFDEAGVPVFGDIYTQEYSGTFGRVALAQLDSDDPLELVVAHGTPGGKPGSANLTVDVHDDLTAGLALLDTVVVFTGNDVCLELAPGQYDDDPEDELAIGLQTWQFATTISWPVVYNHFVTYTLSYDWTGSEMEFVRQDGHGDRTDWEWDVHGSQRRERFVAADLTDDGVEELCWIDVRNTDASSSQHIGGNVIVDWQVFLRSWNPINGSVGSYFLYLTNDQSQLPFGSFRPGYRGGDLAVVDDDGSGDDNLLVTLAIDEFGPGSYAWQSLVFDTSSSFTVGWLPGPPVDSVPIMTGGDFDGEGLRLRYTGVKYTELADPIPMVLLAGPPTKAGIAQSTGATGSSYTVSDGTSQAYSVSTSTSFSFSSGVEWEDLTGNFGASVKQTLTSAVEKSTGSSSTITTSQTFSGSHDDDSIVFEGTLHMLYEYEVVQAQDPAALGEIVSINVPVATKVFKWTTDFFDAAVEPEDRIPADVFTHTIGDPSSYQNETELTGLLEQNGGDYDGWEGSELTVGQGSASNGVGLLMTTVLSQGDTYTFGVKESAEFKVGGVTYGASVALSNSSMYEVSVSHATSYDGTVGDIEAADWAEWFYDVGMVVYTRETTDAQPFQVLSYWAQPLGSGYLP